MILTAWINVLFTSPLPLSEINTEPLPEATVSGNSCFLKQVPNYVSGGVGLKWKLERYKADWVSLSVKKFLKTLK